MSAETLAMIMSGQHHKVMFSRRRALPAFKQRNVHGELIPLCHPLLLSKVEVQVTALPECNQVHIESLCKLTGKTGVEMEALTAAGVAL